MNLFGLLRITYTGPCSCPAANACFWWSDVVSFHLLFLPSQHNKANFPLWQEGKNKQARQRSVGRRKEEVDESQETKSKESRVGSPKGPFPFLVFFLSLASPFSVLLVLLFVFVFVLLFVLPRSCRFRWISFPSFFQKEERKESFKGEGERFWANL